MIVATLILRACNGEKETEKCQTVISGADKISTEITTPVAEKLCYSYEGKDTIKLNLVLTGAVVTGDLHYHYASKNDNMGAITGIFKNDTLKANYTLSAKGISSVREVIFLKTAEGFKEGYGPVKDNAGKMVFADLTKK